MFDAETARFLQSAPPVPDLDPQEIPAQLTRHYVNLISARLRAWTDSGEDRGSPWPLARIADTYELIASLQIENKKVRRAAAFVAGTAQQILARAQRSAEEEGSVPPNIDRDRVDPTLAAAVLFLAAEQYADAHEAASAIRVRPDGQLYEATVLSKNIADLARGRLGSILGRAKTWRERRENGYLDKQAFAALLEVLITGIEILAAKFLGVPVPQASADCFKNPREAFERVLSLSAPRYSQYSDDFGRDILDAFGHDILNAYPGPHHLASLLIATYDGIAGAALIELPPPDGADPEFWRKWLRFRARSFPFIWPNHRKAIAKEFYQTGKSGVVILPTGAGKTTVSSLKIAGVLARRKKVVFLAPTHALVEQLTEDLQEMFPKNILGSVVSNDFDRLFGGGRQLQEIEVMTPERCLAMLSFFPSAFSDVGLLVFDECHMLDPNSGNLRRALDGMLCVLGFNQVAPNADMLFLSAMLKKGQEFADWIGELTGRVCVCVDILWKPSRQARGVLIYKNQELEEAKKNAADVQAVEDKDKEKRAKNLREAAKKKLVVHPWAVWGLQHNWLDENQKLTHYTPVLDKPVALTGKIESGQIGLKPNANKVAADLAVAAVKNGLKAIVFVNTKKDAISVARDISERLDEAVQQTETEQELWDALRAELGDLKHALLPKPAVAVPHNSSMIRLERVLAEQMFKRENGAKIIVATPTLAQGLNLPAHIAILAGDKRVARDQRSREDLKAHEILNAAARAGRAGHLANGVVLLVPEPIISFSDGKPLDQDVRDKLKSVLPKDDHCVDITDPLESVLDRIMQGSPPDADIRYLINRMAPLGKTDEHKKPTLLFDLRKSFGAFMARRRLEEAQFEDKINRLKAEITKDMPHEVDNAAAVLASQSGLSMELLLRLKKRVTDGVGELPETVADWLRWTILWLTDDGDARESLLYDVKPKILAACGKTRDSRITKDELDLILKGLCAWITGGTLAEIEKALGGNPNSDSLREQVCPRARELIGSVIPRGFSFIMGLISHIVDEVNPFDKQKNLSRSVIGCLSIAVRKGFDTPEKVLFAEEHPSVRSRVQIHKLWAEQHHGQ